MAWGAADRWQGLVDKFLEQNPDWAAANKVDVVVTPSSGKPFSDKLLTSLAGGTGPDIWLVDPTWLDFQGWMQNNSFNEPLDAYLQGTNFLSDSWPLFAKVAGYHGKLYGVPLAVLPQTMYYNKNRLQELGLPDPANRYFDGSWTFDQLAQEAKRASYVWSAGGTYFNDDVTASTTDSSGTVDGIQYLHDLIKSGVAAPSSAGGSPVGFVAGKYAFTQNWSQLPGGFVRNTWGKMTFDWAVVPPPKANASAQSAAIFPGACRAISVMIVSPTCSGCATKAAYAPPTAAWKTTLP